MVAGLQPRDTLADLLDYARALVTAHQRQPADQVAGAGVLVRVAQPGGDEPDQHLADLRGIKLKLSDLPVLPCPAHDRCPGLHPLSRGLERALS